MQFGPVSLLALDVMAISKRKQIKESLPGVMGIQEKGKAKGKLYYALADPFRAHVSHEHTYRLGELSTHKEE